MDYLDLIIKSGAGALAGFVLGQFVNLVKWTHDLATRARLAIDAPDPNCLILSHSTQVENGEFYLEEIYGFHVRNVGGRIATGVKVQLLKIECRDSSSQEFSIASDHSYPLAVNNASGGARGEPQAVLVPGAATLVCLARWREDSDALFPPVGGLPDYYEEGCSGANEYRFTVAAFGDRGKSVTKVLTIQTGRGATSTAGNPPDISV